MAKSVLDIVIKLSKQGGADQETVKGLVQVKGAILDTAAIAGTLVAAGYTVKKVFDETVGTLVTYADQVRKVHDATGMTAEDASRLIQILDDQKVSFEQLQTVVAKNGKTYDYSIEGIAKMSDEYLKLTDANKQAEFMQARFGKQWIDFVPVMKQGSQAIRDNAKAVDENLVLTGKAIVETRRWEIELDNFNDKVQAAKIGLGQQLLGIIDGSTVAITKNAQAIYKAAYGAEFNTNMTGRYTQAQRDAWEAAKKQAEAEWIKAQGLDAGTESTDAATQAAEEYAKALQEASKANTDMLGLIGKVASENQSYEESAKQLAEERTQIEQEKAAAIAQGWWEGSQKIQEYNQKLDENAQKVQELADKHAEAMGRIQYDLLITKLSADGLTNAEYNIAQQAGLTFGVFDQASVDTAKNFDDVTAAVANGTAKLQDMQRILDIMKKGYTIDVALKVIANMGTYSTNDRRTHTGPNEKYAAGTQGWKTVPAGYPNDTYPILLSSGERFAVIPNGEQASSYSNMAGVGAGSPILVNVNISSPMTILDEQNMNNMLLPVVINGIRQAQSRGIIK